MWLSIITNGNFLEEMPRVGGFSVRHLDSEVVCLDILGIPPPLFIESAYLFSLNSRGQSMPCLIYIDLLSVKQTSERR